MPSGVIPIEPLEPLLAGLSKRAGLSAFVLDLAFHGVKRANECQSLDGPGIARLGLDIVSTGMHPTPKMSNIVMHRVVAIVGEGVNEAAVTFEEPLRKRLATAGGKIEERKRV